MSNSHKRIANLLISYRVHTHLISMKLIRHASLLSLSLSLSSRFCNMLNASWNNSKRVCTSLKSMYLYLLYSCMFCMNCFSYINHAFINLSWKSKIAFIMSWAWRKGSYIHNILRKEMRFTILTTWKLIALLQYYQCVIITYKIGNLH